MVRRRDKTNGKERKGSAIISAIGESETRTLKLLEVHSLNVPFGQILHMGDEGIGVKPSLFWEPRNEALELRIRPRVAC